MSSAIHAAYGMGRADRTAQGTTPEGLRGYYHKDAEACM
jgi:hypothetical protein